MLAAQKTEVAFGDILIIRSGFMAAYRAESAEQLEKLAKVNPPSCTGVEQSEELVEWVWSNFSAVAGDQPAFESFRESDTLLESL